MSDGISFPPLPDDGLISLSNSGGLVWIEMRPVFAAWTKIAFWCVLGLFLASLGTVLFAVGHIIYSTKWEISWLLVCGASGIVAIFGYMGVIAAPLLKTLYGAVVFDGQSFAITDMKQNYLIPLGNIRWIRLRMRKERSSRIRPEQSPPNFFRMAPAGAIEIEMEEGTVELFRRWEIEDLEWVEQAMLACMRAGSKAPEVEAETSRGILGEAVLSKPSAYGRARMKVVGLLGFCMGGLFVFWSIYNYQMGEASKHWHSVSGTVVDIRVGERQPVQAAFDYRIGHESYIGTRVSFDLPDGDEGVQRLLTGHRAGSVLTVYYDPANPKNSLLVPGSNVSLTVVVMLVGMGFGAAGIYLIRYQPTAMQRKYGIQN